MQNSVARRQIHKKKPYTSSMCLMHLGKIIVSIKIKVSCDIILEQIALNLTVLSTNCYDISSV